MNDKERYIIDSSSLIQASNLYYRFSFAKGFWNQMRQHIESGDIILLDKVFDETTKQSTELKKFVNSLGKKNTTDSLSDFVSIQYFKVVEESVRRNYSKAEYTKWFDNPTVADAFVIASALALNCTIISEEVSSTGKNKDGKIKEIKIPDVAAHVGASCKHIYDMLDALGFHWD